MTKRQGNRARNLTVFGVVIVAALVGIGSLNNRPARQPVSAPTLALATAASTATLSDFAQTLLATTPQNVRATWAAETLAARPSRTPRPTGTPAPEEPTLSLADQIDATGEAAEPLIRRALLEMPEVLSVNRIGSMATGDNGLEVAVRVDVRPADVTLVMAEMVYQLVLPITGPMARFQVDFEIDGRIERTWTWSAAYNIWQEFSASGAPVATATPAGEARATITPLPITVRAVGVRCPANCSEAVALGWTAQQAAQCSHLDRDGDGVACYGD